jgi:hypothetical protein
MADSALISVSDNVRRLTTAKRAITINAMVASLVHEVSKAYFANRLVNGDEAVSRVDEVSIDNACSTVVPVWTVEALVTDAIYVLNIISFAFHVELDILLTLSQPSQIA